jgi:hypothetical protein
MLICLILAYTSTNGSQITIGFTTLSTLQVYLPSGNQNNNYAVQLLAEIRDNYGAISTYNLSTVIVRD